MTADLALFVIHWNAPEWCVAAVTSLRAGGGRVDVGVVDNSPGSSPPLRQGLPHDVHVLTMPTNVGYAGAANAAIAHWRSTGSSTPFIGFAAHDVAVRPGDVDALVEAMEQQPALGVVAPALVSPDASGGGLWDGVEARQRPDLPPADRVRDCDWVSGTLMVVRRECVEAVGAFDESLHSYAEDLDFCLRAGDAGWQVGCFGGAFAWGRGSVDGAVAERAILENQLRVARSRASGRPAMKLRIGLRLGRRLLSGMAGSVAFWRASARRAESRRVLGLRVAAIRRRPLAH